MMSAETRKKISLSHKGKILSKEHRLKIGLSLKGRIVWNKGRKLGYSVVSAWKPGHRPSEIAIQKTRERVGDKHPRWRGGYENKLWHNRQGRYLRKYGILGNHSLEEWLKKKVEYANTCPSCRRKEPGIVLTVDHVIPVSLGGSHDISNIQPLCRKCNSIKNKKIIIFAPV